MSGFAELGDIMRQRRSVRMFKRDPVDRAIIEQLVDAAIWAPSASNRQDWEFSVVVSDAVKRELAQATRAGWEKLMGRLGPGIVAEEVARHSRYFSWFADSPVVIVISARECDGYMVHMCGVQGPDIAGHKTSAAMAAQNLMLAAHALGLGSCCLTAPLVAATEIKSILGLGQRRELVCLVALGWPDGVTPAVSRKKAADVMRIIE